MTPIQHTPYFEHPSDVSCVDGPTLVDLEARDPVIPWQDATYELVRCASGSYEVTMRDAGGRIFTTCGDDPNEAIRNADAAWLRRNPKD